MTIFTNEMETGYFAHAILEQLRTECCQAPQARPLCGQHYDESHQIFEGSSTQQAQILAWLSKFFASPRLAASGITEQDFNSLEAIPAACNIASIGCGSGILDLPLIGSISETLRPLRYIGIEPNGVACERFRSSFSGMNVPGVQLDLQHLAVHDWNCNLKYDFIHAVHSLYYFSNPASDIAALLERLQPSGRLVVFHAPRGPLNQLSDCFWSQQTTGSIWFSEELETHLKAKQYDYEKHSLVGKLNITPCFDSSSKTGQFILDFILQTDSSQLSDRALGLCLEFLKLISAERDWQWFAPHPVDVFIVEPLKKG